jgi:hypothetical protein
LLAANLHTATGARDRRPKRGGSAVNRQPFRLGNSDGDRTLGGMESANNGPNSPRCDRNVVSGTRAAVVDVGEWVVRPGGRSNGEAVERESQMVVVPTVRQRGNEPRRK